MSPHIYRKLSTYVPYTVTNVNDADVLILLITNVISNLLQMQSVTNVIIQCFKQYFLQIMHFPV